MLYKALFSIKSNLPLYCAAFFLLAVGISSGISYGTKCGCAFAEAYVSAEFNGYFGAFFCVLWPRLIYVGIILICSKYALLLPLCYLSLYFKGVSAGITLCAATVSAGCMLVAVPDIILFCTLLCALTVLATVQLKRRYAAIGRRLSAADAAARLRAFAAAVFYTVLFCAAAAGALYLLN